MKGPARWLAGFAAMCTLACAQAPPPVDLQAETEALRAAALAYHEGAATMDTDAVAGLYAPDAVVYAPDTPTVEGEANVQDFVRGFASVPGIQVTLELTDVVVSPGGQMGYTLGVGTMTMDGPDGAPVVEHLRDFHVWRKDATGSWKLVVDIWNSPTPLEAPTS